MKVIVPANSGFQTRDMVALRRLSRPALRLIAGELRDPDARTHILRILRSRDPEWALAVQVSNRILDRVAYPIDAAAARVSDQLGADVARVVPKYEQIRRERIAIKKEASGILKAAKRAAADELKEAKQTHDKALIAAEKQEYKDDIAAAKSAYKDATSIYEKEKLSKDEKKQFVAEHGAAAAGKHWAFFRDNRTGELVATQAKTMQSGNFFSKAGRAIKPFVPIIIGAIGAVLALPTGGASLALAAVASAGYQYNQRRIQVNKAKRQNRAISKQMKDQVKAEEAALKKQLDDLYQQHPDIFAAAGITSGQWASMTIAQKLAVVERINSGQMPSSTANTQAAAEATGQTAPTGGQTWQQAIQSSPIVQQWSDEAGDVDAATEGIQTPTGVYDVYVEGRKVGSAQSLADASGILAANSKAGDRVEMVLDGRSLGLKIVTDGGGVISVPPELEGQVRAASRSQVDGIIQRATAGAATTASPSGGGGGLWALLLVGGGALALAAGGKHR